MKQLVATVWLALLTATAFCQENPRYSPEIEAQIEQVEHNLAGPYRIKGSPGYSLKERMAFYHVRGVSIAVIHDYRIEWARGYGWADSAGQHPVTAMTLFQAASISKSLNGVGVLLLAQKGKLDLNADINDYLRSWKFPYDSVSKNKKITVANLLSHTGGLTVHGFPGYAKYDTLPTLEQVLDGRRPANSPAVRSMYEPGLKSEYSGGGITISQMIVMDITNEPYDRYMQREVLNPMGMTASFYTQPPPAAKAAVLATGYRADGREIEGKYHIYPEQAAAGLWTNPTDLCKYIIETQLSYEGKSAKVLGQQYTKLRLTPYIDRSAALGVFITKTNDGAEWFQHGGANEGFRSQYYGSLTGGEGVVVMVNSDNGHIMDEVINSVAAVYHWNIFQPNVKTVITLSPGQLADYAGKYKYRKKDNMFLDVSEQGDHLVVQQSWAGPAVGFFPENDSIFVSTEAGAEIKFVKDQNGKIAYVSVFGREFFDKMQP